ncbi:MAG: hypothetical protein GX640_17305 [Fibrobacter sp.]|nr:hypothetical protein [Fibrobacter sp.]
MLDLLKKTIYTTIGIAVLTREKAEEVGRKIVKETGMTEAEGKQFIEELLKKSDEMRASVEKIVNEKVEIALKKLNIPTQKDYLDLECRIRKLEENSSKQDLR